MPDIETNPALHRELVHLKIMVRKWEIECNRSDAASNAKNELSLARQELREFKKMAQKFGYRIAG